MNFELLKKKRKEMGLTQKELADLCGVSKTTIFNYEKGTFEPNSENLEKLSLALGISSVELLSDKSDISILQDHDFENVLTTMRGKVLFFIESIIKSVNPNIKDIETTTINIFKTLESVTECSIIYCTSTGCFIFFNTDKNIFYSLKHETFAINILNILTIINNTLASQLKQKNWKYRIGDNNQLIKLLIKEKSSLTELDQNKRDEIIRKRVELEWKKEYKSRNGLRIKEIFEKLNEIKNKGDE